MSGSPDRHEQHLMVNTVSTFDSVSAATQFGTPLAGRAAKRHRLCWIPKRTSRQILLKHDTGVAGLHTREPDQLRLIALSPPRCQTPTITRCLRWQRLPASPMITPRHSYSPKPADGASTTTYSFSSREEIEELHDRD
jgi:hypothetical protein